MRWIIFTLFISAQVGFAQESIPLKNGSFEDSPKQGVPPIYWKDCGFINESPPDVHPMEQDSSYWQVRQLAFDGDTYLGMVVRDNETYESVSQALPTAIEAGKCYSMSVSLSQSDKYISRSRITGGIKNYIEPAVFRVYGANMLCGRDELFYESPPINHSEWKTYEFDFKAKISSRFIVLEVFYDTPILFPYCGNVLIDNLSDIKVELCPEDQVLVVQEPKETSSQSDKNTSDSNKETEEKINPKPEFVEPEILKELKYEQIKKGTTIGIRTLEFEADSYSLDEDDFKVLDDIYNFLNYYEDVQLEIGGHTNLSTDYNYAKKLSLNRANAIVDYLVDKGIQSDRLIAKGYGNQEPLINATNKIANELNQRVEIKVLDDGRK